MRKPLLLLSALYLTAIGIGLMAIPLQFGAGAVPPDSPPELLALLRLLGGPFFGIAALNVLARDLPPSPALRAILAANLIGFGAVAANDVHGVLSGEARALARYFLIIHLAFTFAFAAALRGARHEPEAPVRPPKFGKFGRNHKFSPAPSGQARPVPAGADGEGGNGAAEAADMERSRTG